MKPLISVIVPCYNQAQYLNECLQSVFAQTYENWECIIVNDGSPDNTAEIAQKWVEKDARFKYLFKENGGLSSTRNAGLKIATGAFIQFLDCDDFLCTEKFKIVFDSEDAVTNDIIITNFVKFKNESLPPHCKLEEVRFSLETILTQWDVTFTIPIHCGIYKRKFLDNIIFREDLMAKEDFVFWVELFNKNPKIIFINKYLNFYRNHENNMTRNYQSMIENKMKAFKIIHNLLETKDKELFFSARMDILYMENKYLLESKQELLNSKRLKLFNFLIKPFNRLN